MKKSLLKAICIMLIFVFMSLSIFSNLHAVEPKINNSPNSLKISEARFLNMLNHNYVYSEAFDSLEDIVNDSIVALLDKRDFENCSYVSQEIVNNYLFDMFGFKVDDFSQINSNFPYLEGYVYIVPRGYSKYEHKPVSINLNEDGTYTFITDVLIKSHDGVVVSARSKTLFIENKDSIFGYNIVVSEIVNENTNLNM